MSIYIILMEFVNRERPPPAIAVVVRYFLTERESNEIYQQLKNHMSPNRQVLWSGMFRNTAQLWADNHDMQTLATAMGPLMETKNSLCPCRRKSPLKWAKYVHGASVIFAFLITKGEWVTVLSQPPPQRFHPSGHAYYQMVEEPIIMGMTGNEPVAEIFVVHPTVIGAEDYMYLMWPIDQSSLWNAEFGNKKVVVEWRLAKVS